MIDDALAQSLSEKIEKFARDLPDAEREAFLGLQRGVLERIRHELETADELPPLLDQNETLNEIRMALEAEGHHEHRAIPASVIHWVSAIPFSC
jgi:hypothetical protein